MKKESPVTERNWPKRRAALSASFDLNCYRVASAQLALQARELTAWQREKAGSISARDFNLMAQAVRKAQETGRIALGEVVESAQMEMNLRVIYDDKPHAPNFSD